ncbi:MAG TPA: FecR domain-containing protein [Anaerohalosphaeraceae bacterium]|nr:FecR domain-containing protein [Anaerohalosphaeraceae bacterium]
MTELEKIRVHELVIRMSDKDISPEEFSELDSLIASSPEAARYYNACMIASIGLHQSGKIIQSAQESIEPILEESLWRHLAESERTAAAVQIEKQQKPFEKAPVDPMPYNLSQRNAAKRLLVFALTSIAALLCMMIYVYTHPRPIKEPVAVLVDQYNARWASNGQEMNPGLQLFNGQPLYLMQGVAKILFDYGAEVVIQGPAEVVLISPEKVSLQHGRLYANVPRKATGFIVETPRSTVIDLGTEFGIKVDVTGAMDIHMFKGKANLVLGPKGRAEDNTILTAQQARRIDAETGAMIPIEVQPNSFIRDFNSQKGLVWRGDNINLADIVGGGNGFGTGQIGYGIDPVTGLFVPFKVPNRPTSAGSGRFVPVHGNPFIDGIFVPDGGAGLVQVSSQGHCFEDCPDTNGLYWIPALNGGQITDWEGGPMVSLLLQDKLYGDAACPAIFLHSNLGITFDLEAIRQMLPAAQITEFRSVCGISQTGPNRVPYADFWVLVDGQLRFEQRGVKAAQLYDITVPIRSNDRFLTLITTDGGEEFCLKDEHGAYAIDSDWALFGTPTLVLEAR